MMEKGLRFRGTPWMVDQAETIRLSAAASPVV